MFRSEPPIADPKPTSLHSNYPVRDLIRLPVLESASRDRLRSLLEPHAEYLGLRGVCLDEADYEPTWLRQLDQVLNRADPSMPAALENAMLDIAELANDAGHERLLEVGVERQLSLFAERDLLSPTDLAIKAYLEHREIFDASLARVAALEVRRFVEFSSPTVEPLVPFDADAARSELADRCSRWFATRNRTGFCEVYVDQGDDQITWQVVHGQPPRTLGIVTDHQARDRRTLVPTRHDFLVLDRRRGVLAVHAQFPIEEQFYRRAIGAVYFGGDEHFSVRPLYTGQPIVDEGPGALGIQGVPGLAYAELRELTVASSDRRGGVVRWTGDNLTMLLNTAWARELLSLGRICHIKLGLRLDHRARPLTVEVHPPNRITFDRRVAPDVVREFLLLRGFMVAPGRTERQVAE